MGVDNLGPLPRATGNVRFCIVFINYFNKWVEATPLATLTEFQHWRFIWKQVICRFGLPEHLSTDNIR